MKGTGYVGNLEIGRGGAREDRLLIARVDVEAITMPALCATSLMVPGSVF